MRILSIMLLLFTISFCFDLQKPSTYEKNININGWFMSEKLDGIRAYWDGKELYTRNKNKIFAPAWFTKDFPPFELDGELWTKRGDFENIQSIVLSQQESEYWENITYNIFEVPNANGNFQTRVDFLEDYLKQTPNKYIKIIPQIVCKDENHLNKFLQELLKNGAEGVIIKNPNLSYESGRTKNSLKVKEFFDDEALVIDHNFNSDGSFKSLKVKLKNGVIFNLGGGFKKEDRLNPPKIGSNITFKYYGFTKNGKPKFASFLRVREVE
ncbi:DNA ligase [Aliarcobacter skirrowii]|uniref:DNA ligase n=1 Tax=Aliarcobacter skirrowii TaxID=28200 RepID=UPI0029A78BA4|nr:DNA ligase [Aliarcobacter skirrowii]MDX4071519.1 DNA ligase [Aliarcobacter skirrowii]